MSVVGPSNSAAHQVVVDGTSGVMAKLEGSTEFKADILTFAETPLSKAFST